MRCTRITTMVRMTDSVSATPTAWTNPLRDPRDLRLPRIAGPCSIVIFGVTGDLSRKKLLPAIYDLANRGLLPPSFGLTGFARRDWTEDHFRDFVREHVQQHCRTPFRESTWKQLAKGIRFVQGTFDDSAAFARLSDTVAELDRDRGTRGNHAFYMSVPPRAFPVVARQLADCGLARSSEGAWRRVIIEKPFGHDLASAKELDRVVSEVFDPSSVFRIDHYLGKETVQNMLALRFANAMYEPIWNANYVDHVQITMAEDIGVAGRAGYYDGIGAARDIIQNHLLQLLAPDRHGGAGLVHRLRPDRREDEDPLRGASAEGPRRTHRSRTVRRRLAGARMTSSDTWRRRALTRRLPPRPMRRSGLTSTPAAGPVCRSIFVPASVSASVSPRSPSCSSARRTCRSSRPRHASSARTRS